MSCYRLIIKHLILNFIHVPGRMSLLLQHRVMVLLCSASAVLFASLGMTRPLVVLLANSLGASPTIIGLIVSLYALVPLFLALQVGAATDRYGPRPVLVMGSVGFAAAMLIVAVKPTIPGLVISQIGGGLFQLGCVLAFQTYISSIGKPEELERNFGWYTMFVSLGQLFGPLLGGTLADHLSYAAAFWGSTGLSLLTTILVLALPRAENRTETRAVTGAALSRAGALLRRAGVRTAMISSFSVLFTLGVRGTFFPVLLTGLGYSASQIGLLISFRAAAAMVTRPFLPKVVAVSGSRYNALMLTITLAAVGLALTPAGHSFWFFLFVSALVGIGTGLCQPLSMLIVADDSSDQERGLAMGLRLMGNRFAQLVSPLLFGTVTEAVGISATFVVGGGLLFCAVLFLLRWKPTASSSKVSKLKNIQG